MEKIVLDGISISVTKKDIKNMYIRIVPPDGEVRITAPYSMSDEYIRSFAASRMPWIQKHKKRFQQQTQLLEQRYTTGESYYVWGKKYDLDVRFTETGTWVHLDGERLVLYVMKESTVEQREAIVDAWLRKEMKAVIPRMLEKCENRVGVQAKEWRIKKMRTRWGTCNVEKKRIWLNLQLAKKEPECLEYVITHELVHLLERNHNTKFYRYMDQFYPDWRLIKNKLNYEQT